MNQDIEYITLQEAAELIKLKPRTIYQYVWEKQMPKPKPIPESKRQK